MNVAGARTKVIAALLLAVLALPAACSRGSDGSGDPTRPTPTLPPTGDAYRLEVIAVDVVNKDSGASLEVGGLPAQGGSLDVP